MLCDRYTITLFLWLLTGKIVIDNLFLFLAGPYHDSYNIKYHLYIRVNGNSLQ
jgi:hypothetical protein